MFRHTQVVLGIVAVAMVGPTVDAQQSTRPNETYRTGPRVGITWLAPALVDSLNRRFNLNSGPVISQFGWQYERTFASLGEGQGPVALNEWILMVGGLDQGIAIPSITWLVGIRTQSQFEIGVGPNLAPAGVSLAVSVGQTFHWGGLNVPLNIAVVPSRYGKRVSVLTGFNLVR